MGIPITIADAFVRLEGSPIGNQPRLIAGAVITAGQPIRIGADGKAHIAIATQGGDAPTATTANVYGIALSNAQADQPISVAVSGIVTINSTSVLLPGQLVCCNAGGLILADSLEPGDYTTLIGVAIDTTRILLHIWPTGQTVPTPPTP